MSKKLKNSQKIEKELQDLQLIQVYLSLESDYEEYLREKDYLTMEREFSNRLIMSELGQELFTEEL